MLFIQYMLKLHKIPLTAQNVLYARKGQDQNKKIQKTTKSYFPCYPAHFIYSSWENSGGEKLVITISPIYFWDLCCNCL